MNRIIDLGCGQGDFVRIMIKTGYDAVGLEISVEMIREADNTHIFQGDAVYGLSGT